MLELKNNLRSSVLVFCFWVFSFITSTFMFRTKLLEEEKEDLDLTLFFINYFLLVVSLIMSMVSEKIVNLESEKKSDLVILMIYFYKNAIFTYN